MKQQIANENVRDFLSMAKRLTPYLTDSEFETVLRIYNIALDRLEGEDKQNDWIKNQTIKRYGGK